MVVDYGMVIVIDVVDLDVLLCCWSGWWFLVVRFVFVMFTLSRVLWLMLIVTGKQIGRAHV